MNEKTKAYCFKAGKALLTVMIAFFVYYAVQIVYSIFYTLFLSLVHFDATAEELTALIAKEAAMLSLISGVVTLVILALLPIAQRRSPLEAFSLCKMPPRSIPLMLFFGLCAAYSLNIVLPLIPFPEWAWDVYNESIGAFFGETDFVMILTVVILAPILEEILFRAIAVGQLSHIMPKWVAVVLTSLIFGLAHGNLIQGTYAAMLGLLLGLIYIRYDSVLPGMLFHAGFNVSSFLLELFPEYLYGIICLFALLFFIALFVLFLFDTYMLNRKRKERTIEPLPLEEERTDSFDADIETQEGE